MKDELLYIGEKIVKNDYAIAQNIAISQNKNYTQALDHSGMPLTDRLEFRTEIIRYLGLSLFENLDSVTEKIINWSYRAAEFAVLYNVSLTDSLRALSSYRRVIWEVFTEELEKREFAAITMLDVSKIIDPLIDKISGIYGEVYEQHNNRLMKLAYSALEELSVPVVPFFKEMAIIPIVGEIDTHRARLLMEISLSEGERLKLSTIIFDLSGVAIMDTMVADQIFKIVKALKLTGIETVITGIRPEIAQTIVKLGLNFGDIKTYSQLQQALSALGVASA